MKAIGIIGLLLIHISALGQSDTLAWQVSISTSCGFLNTKSVNDVPYALDLFALTRNTAPRVSVEYSRKLRNGFSWVADIGFFSSSLMKEELKSEHVRRHPDYYVYYDFYEDVTGSTGEGLRVISLDLGLNKDYRTKHFTLTPIIRTGGAIWGHRDYEFITRESGTNHTSTFRVEKSPRFQFSGAIGLRLNWKRWPKSNVEMKYLISPLYFNYDMSYLDNQGTTVYENVAFKSRADIFFIGLVLRQ